MFNLKNIKVKKILNSNSFCNINKINLMNIRIIKKERNIFNLIKFNFSEIKNKNFNENIKIKPYNTPRDHLISGYFNNGTARFVFSDISNIITDCRKRFNIYEYENLNYLSLAYNTTLFMNSFLQGEERVKLSTQFSEYFDIDKQKYLVKNIYSESISTGEVRGYLEETIVKSSDFEGSIDDYLKISKILYGQKSEITSMIKLGENKFKEEDIFRYFEESEQIKTYLKFKLSYKEDVDKMLSHGFIIQKMPFFDEDLLQEKYNQIISNEKFIDIIEGNLCISKIVELFSELNFDVTITNRTPVDFFCRCSLDTFKTLLKSFPKEEILDMQNKKQDSLKCRTCNTKYILSDQDFNDLIKSD
jgi:molecular chaperone Hsp33